jgi:hypothetical protein
MQQEVHQVGINKYTVKVTIKGRNGLTIERTVTLSALRASDAKYRAGIVAVKPGQAVLNTVVVK